MKNIKKNISKKINYYIINIILIILIILILLFLYNKSKNNLNSKYELFNSIIEINDNKTQIQKQI